MVYKLRASDVGQRLATSIKACTHQPWRVRISRQNSTSVNDIFHYTRILCFGQMTQANDKQPWQGKIGCGILHLLLTTHIPKLTSAVNKSYKLWPMNITEWSSTLFFTQRHWHAHYSQLASDRGSPPSCIPKTYLPTSTVDFSTSFLLQIQSAISGVA